MVLNAHVTEGKSGSIGPTWPPKLTTSNRLKGIKPELLLTPQDTRKFIDDVHTSEKENPGFSRVSLRAFVERSERKRLGSKWNGLLVEGIIPVDHVIGNEIDMVYLGRNEPSRIPRTDVFKAMLRANFSQTVGMARPDPKLLLEYVLNSDYAFERLTNASISPKDIVDLVALYKEAFPIYMFPITNETIMDLLKTEGNIFLVARHQRQIVSAMIAEYTTLAVEGKPVHIFELSDFATSESVFGNHQGKKLMTALQIQAIGMIRELHGNGALIYAEDRGQLPAVVRSSFNAGLIPVGALPIHVRIGGKRNPELDEGIFGMETLVPVAWLPQGVKAPAPVEVLDPHGVQL